MGIVTITNDDKTDKIVAGKIIPPGESRQLDESLVTTKPIPMDGMSTAPKPPASEPTDPLIALQREPVKTIQEALEGLQDDQLIELCRLEEEASDKPRSTLLAAIHEEQLRRASESNGPSAADR